MKFLRPSLAALATIPVVTVALAFAIPAFARVPPGYVLVPLRAIARADASAGVRQAVPSAEAYYFDHNRYAGMTAAKLRRVYDSHIPRTVKVGWAENGQYCIENTVMGQTARYIGPGGTVVLGAVC